MPDYTSYPILYKLRKVARYARLYGPFRTIAKARSQYHMRAEGGALPTAWRNPRAGREAGRNIGIIGCGNFAYSTVAFYCDTGRPGSVRAAYDPVGTRAVSLCTKYGALYAAASPGEIIQDPAVETIFIASNHASHAEFAIAALAAGKTVHIEKPHVVSDDQLARLVQVVETTGNSRIYLGFNRPRSAHYRRIREVLDRQPGPLMINWFVAGHAIDDSHWYFAAKEGGRILGNLCHWTDLSLRMVGVQRAAPITVVPGSVVGNRSDFALTFNFADGSVASITFSAKGHTFDGVREYLNVHRGDALISMRDFHQTVVDVGADHSVFRTVYRDHGHGANIHNSLGPGGFEPMETVVLTARLFLAAKRAIDENSVVIVS